jgi:hypothetical protein
MQGYGTGAGLKDRDGGQGLREQVEECNLVFPSRGEWRWTEGPLGTKMSSLTMACSILLSMPTRLPEPLERHGGET